MADGAFNISKGRLAYYASLPAANDAILVILLKAAGLEADATLADHDNLSLLLAATNDECDATNYVRKTAGSVTITVDDTNNRVDLDFADVTWTALGGATNNSLGKLVTVYDPDTTGGTDADLVPLTFHDFVVTTDGTDLTAQVNAAGFARAA